MLASWKFLLCIHKEFPWESVGERDMKIGLPSHKL